MGMQRVLLFATLDALCFCSAGAVAPATANVSFGLLAGNALQSLDEFLGIPFASPPTRDLRLSPPVDWVQPYHGGARSAVAFGPRCPQLSYGGSAAVPQEEDCLFLNIWAPRRPATGARSLPVLVFLYGGSFISGAGDMYNGTDLAEGTGAVVVNVNYRVGALGFVVLGDAPGNFGLLDQQSALRWIQREVHAFGGDPSSVLLFGESSGSESTAMHMLLPQSAGLFSAAIMESGVADTIPRAFAQSCGAELAGMLGCRGGNALQCVRSRGWQDVLAAQNKLLQPPVNGSQWDVRCAFWTAVDGAVVPQTAEVLMQSERFHRVPMIVGINHDEGRVFSFIDWGEPINFEQFRDVVQKVLTARGRQTSPGDVEKLLAAYGPSTAPDFRPALGQLLGDFLFICGTRRFLRQHQRVPGAPPAFKYVFSQRAERDPAPADWGVYHSSELPFVFGPSESGSISQVPALSPAEGALGQLMRGFWRNLAVHGDPNENVSGTSSTLWPRYTIQADEHLELQVGRLATGHQFHKAQCDVWDELGDGRRPHAALAFV